MLICCNVYFLESLFKFSPHYTRLPKILIQICRLQFSFLKIITMLFFCSIMEEITEKDYTKLIHCPTGAHWDAYDTFFVKLYRSQWTVQSPHGKLSLYAKPLSDSEKMRTQIERLINVKSNPRCSDNKSFSSPPVRRVNSSHLFLTLH